MIDEVPRLVGRSSKGLKQAKVERLVIRIAEVAALAPEERYVYYLLGHFFNELMCLQKLLAFAIPKHEDERPLRQLPEMAQALFLFRIAAGKLWEAKLALDEKTCTRVWTGVFVPLCTDGKARWKAWQRQISSARWVRELRDKHSFHYPRFDQWCALLSTEALVEDDQVFLGKQSGNSFWAGSDNIAQHWMFSRMSRDAPGDAVDPMIGALIDLLGDFNGLVEEALTAFVVTRLLTETDGPQPAGLVASPDFREVKIPFWTWMPPKAR